MIRTGFLAIATICTLLAGCRGSPSGPPPTGSPPTEQPLSRPEPVEAGRPRTTAQVGPGQAGRAAEPVRISPFPGIVVFPDQSVVEIEGESCLTAGWLEQIACSPNTREYEALVMVEARPSQIHAALLMAGLQPGEPGHWSRDGESLTFIPPTGDVLDVLVRYSEPGGRVIQEPIRNWIADHLGRQSFPSDPWVFAGSRFAENPEWMGPGEHYVADVTGSIIGLVTFGDEVIGFSRVFADDSSVQKPEWDVATDHVPPLGTPVWLILRPHATDPPGAADP